MTMRSGVLAVSAAALCAASLGAQALPNQGPADPAIPRTPASTPEPGGRYWQQRADYTIVATLDESRYAVRAQGALVYTNQSPDTLRELWLHQHLNAFRPGSRWSAVDARERRERFQALHEPDYGYERFTADPVIGNTRVRPEYPLAPDSTVVRLALPTPLPPGGQVAVRLEWEARPSTTVRRQGRRDRSYDFAQWYPRVAVYDRHGWKPNALVPAGEFYGEFGSFDVTLLLPQDQVVGATGVPVQGDPGWARVSANGNAPVYQRNAYGAVPAAPRVELPRGFRSVRFVAKDVHHFGWSVSPHFLYEGSAFVRPARAPREGVRVWDTVAVHALYRGDAEAFCAAQRNPQPCMVAARDGWRQGAALRNGERTLTWLEDVFGTYAYPQLTILRRLDGGGTEFPMMMQNGSNSASLVTHEGAHIYAHGMLGNNEWQSGWLDEGLASYVTSWQDGDVRVAVAAALERSGGTDTAAARMRAALDNVARQRGNAVAGGTLDAIGTRADLFRSFTHYNTAVYTRAEEMYAALHDLLGDSMFRRFLNAYYAEWAFRHVDRWAMQGVAERVSGQSLGWFFEQWVHTVGAIEYGLSDVRSVQEGAQWRTTVRLTRRGAYRHAMPVGVRLGGAWTVVRGDPLHDDVELSIVTPAKPDAVRIDPFGTTDALVTERPPEAESFVIAGAQVADGSGGPLVAASVRVIGDSIAEVGQVTPRPGEAVVDGRGLVLAPGFIDIHNHSTVGLEREPAATTQVAQGITTLAVGQDGSSPWPLPEYLGRLRAAPPAVNVVTFAGHATIRRLVMGDDFQRVARPNEVARMAALVTQAMDEGAFGLSSGLEYEVGSYSATDELVAMARAAGARRGLYISHIRDEANLAMDAIAEAIAIGERGGLPVQITHIKLGTVSVWGRAAEVVNMVEAARRRGVDVTADVYPYLAWQSTPRVLIPNKRYTDSLSIQRGLDDIGGAKNVQITRWAGHERFVGQRLDAAARSLGVSDVEAYRRFQADEDAGMIGHTMIDDDLRHFMRQPWAMVASDGGIANNHPRGAGTFPRVLGRYVRERQWLTLGEAVRKMAALPAARLGLRDRGLIKPGMKADLVLFDPTAVIDHATFESPRALARGVTRVWVNGAVVWDGAASTAARPGRVLARPRN